MLKDFKEFAIKGNVVDLAVGVIVGAAFGTIVKSLVDDIIMPPIGFLMGNVDFQNLFLVIKKGVLNPGPYQTSKEAIEAGAILMKYGTFANTIVSFLIITFSVFVMISQLKKLQSSTPIPTPPPTIDQKLLEEIRDLLKEKN